MWDVWRHYLSCCRIRANPSLAGPKNMLRLFSTLGIVVFCLVPATVFADSCSDVVPGAHPTPSPNWDRNPYPGMCYVEWTANGYLEREALKERCSNIPGNVDFEADSGSGRNTCVFRAGAGSGSEGDSGGHADHSSGRSSTSCGPDEKLCEGSCIPDDASCCANGHGIFCPTHGQCCFAPNNPHSHNNYICCGSGQQCVHSESPTAGVCVNPEVPNSSPTPPAHPQTVDNGSYELHICNNSTYQPVYVAVALFDSDPNIYKATGWYTLNRGACTSIPGRFRHYGTAQYYYYAQSSGLVYHRWTGPAYFCVDENRAFTSFSNSDCSSKKLGFRTGTVSLPSRKSEIDLGD